MSASTLIRAVLVALVSAALGFAQQPGVPAASGAAAAQSSQRLTLHGKVVSLEGELLSRAAVWVGPLSSRSARLAESRTDDAGEFTLVVDSTPQLSKQDRLVVRASLSGYEEALDLLNLPVPRLRQAGLDGRPTLPTFTLRLNREEETFEEPSLGLVDAWVLPRLRRQGCRPKGDPDCRVLRTALERYQRGRKGWEALQQVAQSTLDSKLPEGRLLGALALMRMGAWSWAEQTLAPLGRPSGDGPDLPESWFLEGVLLNFLHRPAEATQALKRARESLGRAPLVDLELGRAEFQDENWTEAEESLGTASADRALCSRACYLLTRSLASRGLLEAAAREASELTRCARHKALPAAVESFVADVHRREKEEGTLQAITSVIDQPVPELVKAVTPLQGLDPSASPPPGGLDDLLKQVGQVVEKFFRDFTNTSATEILWQTRLDKNGRPVESRNEEFYYVFLSRSEQGRWWVEEYRGDRKGLPSSPGGLEAGYMTTSGFASSLVVLHPKFQPGMAYRYLGRQKVGDLSGRAGQWAYVIGFAQRPGVSAPLGFFNISQSKTAQLYLQGIAWISVDQHEVIRMRTDLLGPVPEVQLKRETAEVDYRPYRFVSSPRAFWLPNRVSVSVEWSGKRLRNEHNFTQYRLFKVDTSSGMK